MLDQGGWDITLDKWEFINLGTHSQDIGFNTLENKPEEEDQLADRWLLET